MNISGFINRDVHPQNFHLSISIVKKHTFYCVSNKLLYFCKQKSCLTNKYMHIAEIRIGAKLLPQLRWNTHKSLILSYSEYLGRFSDKIYAGKAPGAYSIGDFLFLMLLPFTFPFGRWPLVQGVWSKTCETWVIYHLIFFENVFNKDTFQGIIHIKKLLHHVHPTINIILRWAL